MSIAIRRAAVAGLLLIASIAAAAAAPVFAPGSRVGLELPDGFAASTRFSGFEDPATGASVVVSELPAAAFAEIAASEVDEAFAARGVSIDERRAFAVADGEAILFVGSQEVGGATYAKWILLFGAPELTALVTVQVPQPNADAIADEVEPMLASITVRAALDIAERLAELPFHLSAVAPMRVVNILGGSAVLLTRGPNDVVQGAAQPFLVVTRSVAPVPAGTSAAHLSRAALASTDVVRDAVAESEGPITFAGGEGYEIVAKARHAGSGEDIVVVQWLLPLADSYLRLVGVTTAARRAEDFAAFGVVRDGLSVD